jgi:glycosyltransferase involved in cell wall biosynthesis
MPVKKISIIVTARNYAQFLHECLSSCINQSVIPHEVIYSDDFSTDNSLKVAASVPGIKIVKHKSHQGVVKARNAGVKASSGNVLVFVDGDDMLPSDFLERHLQVFDRNTPFVYCAAQAFGLFDTFWKVHPWGRLFLFNRNFVNTSIMVWKDVFLAAGGWMETCEKTMWDWSLAIRLSRFGTPRKSPAVLLYRQHQKSYSRVAERTDLMHNANFRRIVDAVRKESVRLTIGLVYSGRIPQLFPEWMKQLASDVNFLAQKPQLIVINNADHFPLIPKSCAVHFSDVKIIKGPGKFSFSSETDRRNKVCELLADNYSLIIENATGDIIHLREDDIIPEDGAFLKLFNFITEGIPVKHAAAGVYLNRNPKFNKIVAGYYNNENPKLSQHITKLPSPKPFKVDFTGTGFIMFWKDICPKIYLPYVEGIQAHDWAWCLSLKKMEGSVHMIPDAVCRHYSDAVNYVLPPDGFDGVSPVVNYSKVTTVKNKIKNGFTIIKKAANASR